MGQADVRDDVLAGEGAVAPRRSSRRTSWGFAGIAVAGLLVLVVGLSRGPRTAPAAPAVGANAPPAALRTGTSAPVAVTLVAADREGLSCAADHPIAGHACAFTAPDAKPASDGPGTLKPYTTTDRRQFLATGLWSQAALVGPLPSGRFTVDCTLSVEGVAPDVKVRWSPDTPWRPASGWPVGILKDCALRR